MSLKRILLAAAVALGCYVLMTPTAASNPTGSADVGVDDMHANADARVTARDEGRARRM